MSRAIRFRIVVVAAIVAAAVTTPRAQADTKALFKELIDKSSQMLVTVKCVWKIQGGGSQQEREQEFTGLMIEKGGLVLCSSLNLGTSRVFRRQGASVTPTDIKVLIGDDTEGVEAKLLTSDPELDLSWIQIKEPDSKGYSFLDLARSKIAVAGDRLYSSRRMDKFFDRTIVVNEGLLAGITKKPRELLIPTDSLEFGRTSVGMPVFAEDGAVVGISVLQTSDPEEPTSAGAVLILPVAEVIKATEKAKVTASSEEEEEDEEGDEPTTKPADSAKPEPARKPAEEEEEEE